MTFISANLIRDKHVTDAAWMMYDGENKMTRFDALDAQSTPTHYLYDSNYKARNINGLVTETRVKDAAGNLKAKTQITYDGLSLLDESESTRWENPNTNYRGLVTMTRSWHDISGNQYIDTQAQYDLMGNLRKAWDGRGNMSETIYGSTYDYAYPTLIKMPVPDSRKNRVMHSILRF